MKNYRTSILRTIIVGILLLCLIFNSFDLLVEKTFAAETPVVASVTKLQASNSKGRAVVLKWGKVKGASGYIIYQKNKKTGKYKKIKTIKKGSTIKWTHKRLKKNTTYAYKVVTFKKVKGKNKKSAKSFKVSAITATKSAKKVNVKQIKMKKKSYTMTPGQKNTIKATLIAERKGKKISTSKYWSSSNKSIATVTQKGKVTAKAAGTCYIYCRAHNGKIAKAKVVVKSPYAERIPILTFHRIVSERVKKESYPRDQWVASVLDFQKQMEYLYSQGYKTISLNEFYNWYMKKQEFPRKTVVLTFDDGDYELYYLVLPILKKYGFKGAAFVIGSYVKESTEVYNDSAVEYYIGKDLINKTEIDYPNMEFQSHSWDLHFRDIVGNPIAFSMPFEKISEDFQKEKKAFDCEYIAYPFGACPAAMRKAFHESGMKMAFGFGKYRPATRNDSIDDIYRVKVNGQITLEGFKQILEKALK